MATTNAQPTHAPLLDKVAGSVDAMKDSVQGQGQPKTYMGVDGKEYPMKEIRQEDIDHWHKHGYVIVKDFLHPGELQAALEGFHTYMPSWEEYKTRNPLFKQVDGTDKKTSSGWIRYPFPYANDALNKMAVHPYLVAFAERIHGTDNLRLSHGAIVGKYAGRHDYEQSLHADYTNNTLVVPQRGTENIDLPMIIYYTDVTIDHGPTYVVSKTHGTDEILSLAKRWYHKEEFPHLYEVEKPAVCPAGSVLIYNMRTFHRGSRMNTKEGLRYNQFTAFHVPKPWLASHTYTGCGDMPEMWRFLTIATPREREMIGFPPVGDPYWDVEEHRRGVANRYPEMDMTPYGGRPQ